ncbi:MAG: GNAT family N-acetyltransferase [Anaerolineae bacterium]|nr:GNAT family N-acetyltransferase [Anaerolineae bacterium]
MIYGKRLRLRALERSDLPLFVRWLNDPEVTDNLLIGHPFSMDTENQWYEGMLQRSQYERPLVIELRSGENWQMIGNLSLMDISWQHRSAELGIVIGEKSAWNQGYGTEAIQLLVKHAFDELNLHRIWLRVYQTNPRGRRCYEKAGFRLEGTERESIFKHGRYIDVDVMSILSTDEVQAAQA